MQTCLFVGILAVWGGVAALPSVTLGVTVLVLSARDLRLMGAGAMDRAGRRPTQSARQYAWAGIMMSLLIAACWVAGILMVVLKLP